MKISLTFLSKKVNDLDAGRFMGNKNVSDVLKNDLLTIPWTPPPNYNFPKEGIRNLRFKHNWLYSYEWLVFSETANGALCKYCVFFANEAVDKGEHVKLGSLVKHGLSRYKDALEIFRSHNIAEYHKKSVAFGEFFIASFKRN